MDFTLLPFSFLLGCYVPLVFFYLYSRLGPPSMHRIRICYLVMSAFIVACLLFDFYWVSAIAVVDRFYLFILLTLMALLAASFFFFDIVLQLINLRRMRIGALQKLSASHSFLQLQILSFLRMLKRYFVHCSLIEF